MEHGELGLGESRGLKDSVYGKENTMFSNSFRNGQEL